MSENMAIQVSESRRIRPIESRDSEPLARLIRAVLEEFGCIGPGYASSDPELDDLFSAYQTAAENSVTHQTRDRGYWVIVDETDQRLLGGGGFGPLQGADEAGAICELQKMYFHPDLRGGGFGRKMLTHCIRKAEAAGYREMYLETVPQMENAIAMYQKLGFTLLPTFRGNTGHRSCTVFMSRPLNCTQMHHTISY